MLKVGYVYSFVHPTLKSDVHITIYNEKTQLYQGTIYYHCDTPSMIYKCGDIRNFEEENRGKPLGWREDGIYMFYGDPFSKRFGLNGNDLDLKTERKFVEPTPPKVEILDYV